MNSNPVGGAGNGGGGAEDYILIRDEKPSGTSGGTFTAGAWQTRDLNTIVHNNGGHISLLSNQIIITAGTYRVEARAPGFRCEAHKPRLYNITDALDIIIGDSSYSTSSFAIQYPAMLDGEFTLAATKIIELQHRCQITQATNGFGQPSGFGVVEVYSTIELFKKVA
jgi:hypothetical protein